MKRFIRYLYEYEDGRRMRNVGFVKVDQDDSECIVHIHGKGLRLEGEKELTIYLFYEKEKECIGIEQGRIENVNPAVNYQLKYTQEDVGEPRNYFLIEGIIMENRSHRKYAAVWDDMPVNVNEMRLWTPEDMEMNREESESEEVPEEMPEQEDAAASQEEAQEEPEEAAEEEESASEQSEMEGQEQTAESVCEEPERKCTKIQRQDIARLPRCEWKLSNNSFLLHGYYNYHHLILIEENENTWLGVPGIYHPKEAKAAESLGFPQFIKAETVDIDLDDGERNDGEEFGYWCRHVRR